MGLNFWKMPPMETEKADVLSSKVASSKLNGRGNKYNFFKRKTKFIKREERPTDATGRKVQQLKPR